MSHFSRVENVRKISLCPIKKKPLEKLKRNERDFVGNFIYENASLSDSDFKAKAHYLFMDGKDGKENFPNWTCIIEVLTSLS